MALSRACTLLSAILLSALTVANTQQVFSDDYTSEIDELRVSSRAGYPYCDEVESPAPVSNAPTTTLATGIIATTAVGATTTAKVAETTAVNATTTTVGSPVGTTGARTTTAATTTGAASVRTDAVVGVTTTYAAKGTTRALNVTTTAANVSTVTTATAGTTRAMNVTTTAANVSTATAATAGTTMESGANGPGSQKADETYGTCAAHPAFFPGLVPVLLKKWVFTDGLQPYHYIPRFDQVKYYPLADPTSTALIGLDFFFPNVFKEKNTPKALTLTFNRAARVYLLYPTSRNDDSVGILAGWKAFGWADVKYGANTQTSYGVMRKSGFEINKRVYVLYQDVPGMSVDIPDISWIKANLKNIPKSTSQALYLLISEIDGSAPPEPKSPPGVGTIPVGGRCPDALHATWTTPFDVPEADPDIDGKVWTTWHPAWDPCYFCAYDHDHGSNAGALMGIKPAYSLPAWKNSHQDESHGGFKVRAARCCAKTRVLRCSKLVCAHI
jgi:hypothetical protein